MPVKSQAALSPEQTEFFEREGYLVIDGLLSDDDLQPVIDELVDEIDQRARQLVAEGVLPRTYDELGFEHRLNAITRHTDKVFLALLKSRVTGPAIFNLIRNPKFLDIAEQFCGPELIAS